MNIQKILIATAAAIALAGCATKTVPPKPTGTGYQSPGEIVTGWPGEVTMYDLESSAQQLIGKMLSSPQFAKNYNAVKESNEGRLPIAVIGNIENKTGERVLGRLIAVGDTIRAALFDSGLFGAKDDAATDAIKSRIIRGADGGLEDGALVQLMETHESPDFIVLGDFRHFEDVGGYHTFRLRLAIHSLTTGKVVCEGTQTRVKL